jgi:hypothetical protein
MSGTVDTSMLLVCSLDVVPTALVLRLNLLNYDIIFSLGERIFIATVQSDNRIEVRLRS